MSVSQVASPTVATPIASVAVAFHSGAGHTARQAAAVTAGAQSVAGASALALRVDGLSDEGWAALDAADAIVFGSPTHMGAPSAAFTAFAAATQGRWLEDRWRDKVAAGFTNSGTIAGDKLNTLQTFALLAAQHGMVWVGLDLKAGWATSDGSPDELNRLGSWLGAMSHSPLDLAADVAPRNSDLRTAEHLGHRVAQLALALRRGRAGDGAGGASEPAREEGAAASGAAASDAAASDAETSRAAASDATASGTTTASGMTAASGAGAAGAGMP